MSREMLINVAEMEECRIAVVDNGLLEELYIERAGTATRAGDIYTGRVVNIEAAIQAAFIDFGVGKNGFLHVSDLHPRYFPGAKKTVEISEHIGRRKALKERPPIQDCLKKGQKVVVQVTKEGVRTKGPTLSTYVSLAGKYLVMMPWMKRFGVSHKIEDEEERRRLRQIISELKLPRDIGFIIRTAGADCSKREMQSDLNYLSRLWKAIQSRMESEDAPADLYQESDLIIRTLRDVFDSRINRVICDSEVVARKVKDFLHIAMPRFRNRVTHYTGKVPLFHKYGLETEIAKIYSRRVELKGGGSLVIEPTEAIVAIDVNSGRYRRHQNAEQTAYKTNMEAAVEITRQLRLRDLGGLIICDFIDMRNEKHRREVEKTFRAAMKADRARSQILRMSRFGIIELTRQRMRPSLQSSTYLDCPRCGGAGVVKSLESLSIELMRLVNLAVAQASIKQVSLTVAPEVATFLQNEKRQVIGRVEQETGSKITINTDSKCISERYQIICYDERGSEVPI
jgi:ribonuclease E